MILLLAGVLLLAVGGIYWVRSQAEGAALREQLRASAPVTAQITATPAQVTAQPGATSTQSATAMPTVAATATPRATSTTQRTASSGAAAASVTATETATLEPTPTAALTPTPTTAPAAVGVEPVRIVFPDLKIDTQVIPMRWKVVQTQNGPVSEWVIPQNEAGHHINSARLGEPGNLVISGHNNIYAQVFKPISQAWDNDTRQKVDDYTDQSDLLNGRRIELFDATGKEYDYIVTAFYRLKDTGVPAAQRIANGRYIQPSQDTRLTIVTCWPPTNNTHRLILIAAPAPAQ